MVQNLMEFELFTSTWEMMMVMSHGKTWRRGRERERLGEESDAAIITDG